MDKKLRERHKPRLPKEMLELAASGLRNLGYKDTVARRAVSQAAATLPGDCSMESLLRESLRQSHGRSRPRRPRQRAAARNRACCFSLSLAGAPQLAPARRAAKR